ncbi:hypothetical protein CHARACLAT_015881 [Characodon lateralis]|uniref:Uncharacterized protein n=1 Tax=Characodon lateralis TaxID=208331 RepID=A0ABU7CNI9_9TELE|nr:hypothetical protein [Characodon lateralis]
MIAANYSQLTRSSLGWFTRCPLMSVWEVSELQTLNQIPVLVLEYITDQCSVLQNENKVLTLLRWSRVNS